MSDFLVAIGLVFALEGILFAAFPGPVKQAMAHVTDTPDGTSLAVRIQDLEGVDWVAVYTLEQQADGTWRISGCFLTKEPGQAV